jgi:hypothetical protein
MENSAINLELVTGLKLDKYNSNILKFKNLKNLELEHFNLSNNTYELMVFLNTNYNLCINYLTISDKKYSKDIQNLNVSKINYDDGTLFNTIVCDKSMFLQIFRSFNTE